MLVRETSHQRALHRLAEPEGREFESLRARKAFDLPKLFLRLRTKSQTSDLPMTLAKWFFENSLVDSKGLEFYHRHWEFLRMLGQNPSSSASYIVVLSNYTSVVRCR
jgi:hypothetical protein